MIKIVLYTILILMLILPIPNWRPRKTIVLPKNDDDDIIAELERMMGDE